VDDFAPLSAAQVELLRGRGSESGFVMFAGPLRQLALLLGDAEPSYVDGFVWLVDGEPSVQLLAMTHGRLCIVEASRRPVEGFNHWDSSVCRTFRLSDAREVSLVGPPRVEPDAPDPFGTSDGLPVTAQWRVVWQDGTATLLPLRAELGDAEPAEYAGATKAVTHLLHVLDADGS
jgi:hypothetical protein